MPEHSGEVGRPEDEQLERALLEDFVEPLLRDIRATVDATFTLEWFVDEEMWWFSCYGTSATWCEVGDLLASISGPQRWKALAV